ncbi:MAG: MFS transporter [Spongiibacteraceae bacterium]|nr:MFS transporter [Spongiibacteraceae bacterium]MBN4055389.1 MFS transporter [bacterium AH-315-K03]
MNSAPLSTKEKLGYGLGDTASNIVFQVVINFLLYFYTDVFGISAAAVGTLMLVVRLFDAFTDPLMGGVADRTQSRWGKYRPYLLLVSIPYGVLAVLAFSTPDLSQSGKLIYAYITYALLMTAYTAINIPYSALGGVISADVKERASIQSYRFAMAMVGGALVSALMLPMVALFGGDDKVLGFQLSMGVMATLAVLCFVVCFFTTRERVVLQQKKAPKTSVLADFLALFKNDQWLLVAGFAFLLLVLVAMRGAVTPFYVSYFLGREELISHFVTAAMLAGVVGALSTHFLCKKMCKVKLFKISLWGIVLCHLGLWVLSRDQLIAAFVLSMAANFFHMMAVPLMFSMVPDTVDYGARLSGKKTMAMAFSGHLLAIKLGLAVGGAMAGWLLGYFGYVPNALQTEQALMCIVSIYALGPVVCGVLLVGLARYYRLTDEMVLRSQDGFDFSAEVSSEQIKKPLTR